MKRFSEEEYKEIADRIHGGETRASIAKSFGVWPKVINKIAKDLPKLRKVYDQEIRDEAIRRVKQGETKQAVAEALGINRSAVQNWTYSLGIRNPAYHSLEVQEEAIRRVKNGEQKKTVAEALGVSIAALRKWTKDIRLRRKYTEKEREIAIRRVEDGEAKEFVARDIGIPECMVRKWTAHVDRSAEPVPEDLKMLYLDRVVRGESGTVVARELGINVGRANQWSRHVSVEIPPEKERQILAALTEGKTIAAVAAEAEVPYSHVKRISRIASGKRPEDRHYSADEKQAAVRAIEAGESYSKVAEQFGCSTASVIYWHRNAMESGDAKERPATLSRFEDTEFAWILRDYSQLSDWQKPMAEWMKGETSNFAGAMKSLSHFIIRYLDGQGLPTTRTELLRRGVLLPSYYESSCAQSPGGIANNNIVHRFLEWVLRTPDFSDDSEGEPIPSPAFRNPVPVLSTTGAPRPLQSVRSVLPYGYIADLRERLAAGPNFCDWKLAQSLLGKKMAVSTQAATDWYPVTEDMIDINDPDCVWRIRQRMRGAPILEMWSPVRWIALLAKLQTTGRTGQIRMSDSGEADTYRYEVERFVLNRGPLASGTKRRPWQQGIFRRVPNHNDADQAILHFNTNKTADKNKSRRDMGQECAWPHLPELSENPYYWLEKLRNWQEKYNPIDRKTAWIDIPASRALGPKHEINVAKYPDTCFLFRTPETRGEEHLPVSSGSLTLAWHALLSVYQRELDEKCITHPDGTSVRLIDQETGQTDYPLHGLRVSLITHLIVDGEVPAEIMMKIVGHARLIMTLYYTKPSFKHMQDALTGAAERLDAKKEESIVHFLANCSAEEMRDRVVFNTDNLEELFPGNPKERNPVGWLLLHDGICLAGGNTGPLDGNNKVPGCHNGGAAIFQTKPDFGPVLGGIRNCSRCRWKAAEKHHGPALAATLNNKLYHLHQEQQLAVQHSSSLHKLKAQKAQDEAVGVSFNKMKDLKSSERLYEAAMVRLGNIASDVAALYRMLERVKALPDVTSGEMALAANADLVTMQTMLEETPSELLQLAGICGDVEIYPDLSPGTAIFRRSQLLDAALEREGRPSFFMKLSQEDMLIFGNAFMRKLASHANAQNPLIGLRDVIEVIDSNQSLERFLRIPLAEMLPDSTEKRSDKVIPFTIKQGRRRNGSTE